MTQTMYGQTCANWRMEEVCEPTGVYPVLAFFFFFGPVIVNGLNTLINSVSKRFQLLNTEVLFYATCTKKQSS